MLVQSHDTKHVRTTTSQMDAGVQQTTPQLAEQEEEEDLLGFNLFESETPKVERKFDDLGGGISLSVTCLDEEPIGVQSGQLLWPAAPALSRYLITNWETLCGSTETTAVLEVGAGCGMVGIVTAKLGCGRAVMTDRDLGALELIEQNVVAAGVTDQCTVLPLSWNPKAQTRLAEDSSSEAGADDSIGTTTDAAGGLVEHTAVINMSKGGLGYGLIVAADVIYAPEVVSMLFGSVDALLRPATLADGSGLGAQFLMCQSFPYDAVTEAEIDRCAGLANLRREVVLDRLGKEHQEGPVEREAVKIQTFTRATD